nr:IS1547_2 [Kibdelosporangium sp. MJ126-NF4]CTQ89818.1 IS1547_2 [Kibdelosporangium sp. MJ126-NF4]
MWERGVRVWRGPDPARATRPLRLWAVEGSNGVGKRLAQRLVSDGETVLDVPANLSARARVFSTGHGRKNDGADVLSVALVTDLTELDRRMAAADKQLGELLDATGTGLRGLYGIGPCAARLLGDVGTSLDSPTAAGSRPGTAPRRSRPPAVTSTVTDRRSPRPR